MFSDEETIKYFKEMLRLNGRSMALDLTCEYTGCEEEELIHLLNEQGVLDDE